MIEPGAQWIEYFADSLSFLTGTENRGGSNLAEATIYGGIAASRQINDNHRKAMEHLLDRETEGTVTIAYRCQEMYDGGDFESYPARLGWDWKALQRDEFQGKTEDEATSFLQSWLFFGLLWDYFGSLEGFDLHQFVRQAGDGKNVITTRNLAPYAIRWAQLESSKSTNEKSDAFKRTKGRLVLVYTVAREFCSGFEPNTLLSYRRPRWQLPNDVALSIQILGDTLQHMSYNIYGQQYGLEWGYSPLLVEKMKSEGWCPRAIGTCMYGQHIHMLCYASTLGPPSVRKDHQSCTEKHCSWEQIKKETYKTVHKPPCTQCAYIGPEQDDLTSIYEKGETPFFRLDVALQRYQVVGSDLGGFYTAISHVWADGLGNPKSNRLPFCQLASVQTMVDHLQEKKKSLHIFWWCDTLCIPVGAQNEKYRRQSIENMRWTYLNAAKTLILDAELMHASVHDSPVKLYLRLKLSNWARRLWTFQESNLSRNACIQLADGVMRLWDLFQAIRQDGLRDHRSLYTRYTMIAESLFPPLLYSEATDDQPQPHLPSIWKQLEWRATSWQTDEAVGLATLMRADAGEILKIDDKDLDGRMAKFFEMIQLVPLSLVFQPPPRIARPGFRWAPTSFLTCFRDNPLATFRTVDGTGVVDEQRGLIVRRNYAVRISKNPHEGFSWSEKTFIFTITDGNILSGSYHTKFAYKEDFDAAQMAASGRSGSPVLILLFPAARDGVIACILAEEKPAENPLDESIHTGDFVGIVTIQSMPHEEKQSRVMASEISPQPWRIR